MGKILAIFLLVLHCMKLSRSLKISYTLDREENIDIRFFLSSLKIIHPDHSRSIFFGGRGAAFSITFDEAFNKLN